MYWLYFTSLEINVGKSVKFVHDDIYVISTDTGRKCSHPDSLVLSGN